MSKDEVIIINDEPFYRIPNGTSYDYAPIPKEFKPYFEKLQQENQQLKEQLKEEQEEYDRIFGLWNNRKFIKRFNDEFDEEDKRKNPNRDYASIMPDAEEVYKRYYEQQERINEAVEYINEFEDIKAYYSYEENGYEEYNYDEDFKIELLKILKGGENE